MKHRELLHLYLRAGFGLTASAFRDNSHLSRDEVVDSIINKADKINPLTLELSEFKILKQGTYNNLVKKFGKEKVAGLNNKAKRKVMDFNRAWIDRLATSENILREKMTLFWANIFVVEDKNIWFVQQYNNTLREHALGNFGELVKAVAKEPAMSKYLNNRQNKKKDPNENFARELLELFMLGEGQYTESDVKNAARAFTGWSFASDGSFVLRENLHDRGSKSFMGETGSFGGDEIIDKILKQKQCARYICSKIYRYFINPTVDNDRLEELSNQFYKDYDINNLMNYIFKKDWFYDEENIGSKIKSPIELMVGIQKIVPIKIDNPKTLLVLQKLMGQTLLKPPNVAGWKGDRHWINANSMIVRLKLASVLLNYKEIWNNQRSINLHFNTAVLPNNQRATPMVRKNAWEQFKKEYRDVDNSTLQHLLIVGNSSKEIEMLIESFSGLNKETFCLQLMCLPEFQMC